MSTTKSAANLAAAAWLRWEKFLAEPGVAEVFAGLRVTPSTLAIKYASVTSLNSLGYAEYLIPGDQAHSGNLSDGRRVVVIRKARPLFPRDHALHTLVHLELIERRSYTEDGGRDSLGSDHLGLQTTADLALLQGQLARLNIPANLGGARPYERLKISYDNYEFKLVRHELWKVCIDEMWSAIHWGGEEEDS